MVLKKQGNNSMQTEELIGTGGFHGQPQDYGVIHFLDDSFLDDYSFPMKKLHHKIISHLFSRVVDIRGPRDNMCAAKKTPNKIWCMVYREYILSCKHSLNIKILKKNHLETRINARNNKRESANKNSSSLANFFAPLKYVKNFAIFLFR
jgi:hypothetical protein